MRLLASRCKGERKVRKDWILSLMEDFTCGFLQALDTLDCGMSIMDVRKYAVTHCNSDYFVDIVSGTYHLDEAHCMLGYLATGEEVYHTLYTYCKCIRGLSLCEKYLNTYKFTSGKAKQSLSFRAIHRVEVSTSCEVLPQFYSEESLIAVSFGGMVIDELLRRLNLPKVDGTQGYFLADREIEKLFAYELCSGLILPTGGIYSKELEDYITEYYNKYYSENTSAIVQYTFEETIYKEVLNRKYDGTIEGELIFMDNNNFYIRGTETPVLLKVEDIDVRRDYDIVEWFEGGQPVCIDGCMRCLIEA